MAQGQLSAFARFFRQPIEVRNGIFTPPDQLHLAERNLASCVQDCPSSCLARCPIRITFRTGFPGGLDNWLHMAIEVTCSGCLTRFQVSEKFAGKKGPCPKCKALILIPEKSEEVVVHAPAESGPKDSKGVSVLKPLLRQETKLSRMMIAVIVLGIVAVLGVSLALRFTLDKKQDNTLILALGSIVLAPPLAYAGYSFLRNDELEPYRGRELWMRLLATSAVYPLTWGLYAAVFLYLGFDKTQPDLMYMFFVVPAMVALGGITASASLDLEFGTGSLHYALYLAVTIFLRLLIGLTAHWQVLAK